MRAPRKPDAVPRDDEWLPAGIAIKADVVAWVGKLDAAVDDLYATIDRLPGLIEGKNDGADRDAPQVRRRPEQ